MVNEHGSHGHPYAERDHAHPHDHPELSLANHLHLDLIGRIQAAEDRIAALEAETPTPTDPSFRELGKYLFAADSPWNHPMRALAEFASVFHPFTQALLGNGTSFNAERWDHPLYVAEPTDPVRTVFIGGWNESGEYRYRIPDNAEPALPRDGDRHMSVLANGVLHETWVTVRRTDGDFNAYIHRALDSFGSGIGPRPWTHVGARAYGGSGTAGHIMPWELDAGRIQHALGMGMRANQLMAPKSTGADWERWGFVWPATSTDGTAYKNTGVVPMGQRFAIPWYVPEPEGLTAEGQAIFHCLQQYGVFVVDRSGSNSFHGDHRMSVEQIANVRRDIDGLKRLMLPVLNDRKWTNGTSGETFGFIGGAGDTVVPLSPPLKEAL